MDRAKIQARLEAALAKFAAEGFERYEPALLQPAAVFLDRLGEDFRGRLYLTGEGGGSDLCLRPEYTIPISLGYIAAGAGAAPAAFSYGGPIFRADGGEATQTGIESFGRPDRTVADAEILGVSLDAAMAAGAPPLAVHLGDAGLLRAFFDRLELAPAWRRRLETGLARGGALDAILAPPARGNGAAGAGVLAALEKVDAAGAKRLVEDLLAIAGISAVGGRSASEVAERFLEQAALQEGGIGDDKRNLIERFFAVEGAPDAAADELRKLAGEAGIDLGAALDEVDARTNFLAARGVALEDAVFSTRFPHSIDYYSGVMFEARPKGAGLDSPPLLSGGRYDTLLKTLGSTQDVPAVGAALYVDRLGDAA
jgi:ATP phosphoribosyltransferase regulatory subunit